MAEFEGGSFSRIEKDKKQIDDRYHADMKAATTDSQKRHLGVKHSEDLRKLSQSYGKNGFGGFLE